MSPVAEALRRARRAPAASVADEIEHASRAVALARPAVREPAEQQGANARPAPSEQRTAAWVRQVSLVAARHDDGMPAPFACALADATPEQRERVAEGLGLRVLKLERLAREGWLPERMARRQVATVLDVDPADLFPVAS